MLWNLFLPAQSHDSYPKLLDGFRWNLVLVVSVVRVELILFLLISAGVPYMSNTPVTPIFYTKLKSTCTEFLKNSASFAKIITINCNLVFFSGNRCCFMRFRCLTKYRKRSLMHSCIVPAVVHFALQQ